MSDNEKYFGTMILFFVLVLWGSAMISDTLSEQRKYNCFEKTQNVECLRGK